MKLTDRLLKIADLVTKGKKIADIGTDHGYIPVYLLNKGHVDFAILADVNKGPLENARSEVRHNNLTDKVDLRFYNDTKRSFHAKAYIFEKDNEGEIFIGSSNLSRSAWTSGIEWNYRIDQKTNFEDFNYFKNMFEDLFLNHSIIVNDEELERYSKTWKRPKIYSNINNKREDINYVYEENRNSNNLPQK